MPITLHSLAEMKRRGEKIAMLTCYDALFAYTANQAGVEVLLIGDSLGMVLQGHDSTLPVSMDDMAYHTACVKRGNRGALLMADLPFMASATVEDTLHHAGRLIARGAQVIKLEGGAWLANRISRLAEQGIPICAHLGLTPQAVNLLGGFKLQGREPAAAERLRTDAQMLEQAGATCLLLECVPSTLAADITARAEIPVIGIGAGNATDGQVLVLQDVLGLTFGGATPRFVKNFLADHHSIEAALRAYVAAVKNGSFPAPAQSYSS